MNWAEETAARLQVRRDSEKRAAALRNAALEVSHAAKEVAQAQEVYRRACAHYALVYEAATGKKYDPDPLRCEWVQASEEPTK